MICLSESWAAQRALQRTAEPRGNHISFASWPQTKVDKLKFWLHDRLDEMLSDQVTIHPERSKEICPH